MNLHKSVTPLRDVLYQFALAKRTPDAEVLDEFVRRYPEHAGALTDLAIGIVLDQARGDDDRVAESETLETFEVVADVPGNLAGVADRAVLRHGGDEGDLHTATLNLMRGCGL